MNWLKNIKGRLSGFSGCGRCGDTWDYKAHHSTCYVESESESRGLFPLCEVCWQSLSVEQRLPYYRDLIIEGKRPELWPQVKAAVEKGY